LDCWLNASSAKFCNPKTSLIMIAVLGAGESGVGAALLAQKKGLTVFVSDFGQIKEPYQKELSDNGIEWEQGTHTEERILAADILIKSPGIPETYL
jgi:UDP-N-acetylmuramoylalanine--D-glutamate ligase